MELRNAFLRPGKIREVLDQYGNVKCSVVGVFREDEALDKLPPVMPSPFMRTSSNNFIQPKVGDAVWVMMFRDNPQLLFYQFQGDARLCNGDDLDAKYEDVEVFSKHDDNKVFMYDTEDGWTLRHDKAFVNIKDELNISNGKYGITITDNGLRLVGGAEDQPMVLGNELKECLQELCKVLSETAVAAMTTSQAAGAKLSSGLFGVQAKLQKILSKNNYVS